MPASYTFDVVSTLDGFASYEGGDWGPFWGKGGPELLDHRLAAYSEEQRLVLAADTCRQFVQLLGPSTEASKLDPLNARMRTMPLTVVSSTLEGPLDWAGSTVESDDAVEIVARLKETSEVPLRSHGGLSLNRALMAAGLVDRVRLTIFAVITGQTGVEPIFENAADFDLELPREPDARRPHPGARLPAHPAHLNATMHRPVKQPKLTGTTSCALAMHTTSGCRRAGR